MTETLIRAQRIQRRDGRRTARGQAGRHDSGVIFFGPIADLEKSEHPHIQEFLGMDNGFEGVSTPGSAGRLAARKQAFESCWNQVPSIIVYQAL